MPRVVVNALTAGEFSPKLVGRPDLQRYGTGARTIENFIVHITGLWEYREGFRYRGAPKFADKRVRLWPFRFSDEQTYILEFGDLYLRFWRDGGLIADPAPIEIVTPWNDSAIWKLRFTQSADLLFIFSAEGDAIRTLTRSSHVAWALGTYTLRDGPYLQENLDDTLKVSRTANTGTVTLTWTGYAAGDGPLVATDVGRHIRIRDKFTEDNVISVAWRWLIIDVVTDAATCTATIQEKDFKSAATTDEAAWRLGLYNTTTKWPIAGLVHEQRLWLAGCVTTPDRIDASNLGDYPRFAPGTAASDALAIGAATPDVNRIRAMVGLNDVIAFGVGSELRIGGAGERSAMSPTNISAKPMSTFGSSDVPPLVIGNSVIFVDRHGMRVREYFYDIQQQGYVGGDLTLLADHIAGPAAGGGLVGMTWQNSPIGLLWCARNDGLMACCTYAKSENVQAWHRHPMGAAGVVESVACISGPTQDEVWVIVRRLKGTTVTRSVERWQWSDPVETPIENRCHLDMALTLDNRINANLQLAPSPAAPFYAATTDADAFAATDVGQYVTYRYDAGRDDHNEPNWKWALGEIVAFADARHVTLEAPAGREFPVLNIPANRWRLTVDRVTGMTPFIGTEVTLVGDGRLLGRILVATDAVDLPSPASIVHAGYPYTGRMHTMPLEAGAGPGAMQGRPQRIGQARLRVVKSTGGKYGTALARLQAIAPYTVSAAPLDPPTTRTTDHDLTAAGEWTGMPAYWLLQEAPMPLNVAMLIPDLYVPAIQP